MNINLEIFKRNIKLQELGIEKLSNIEKELFNFLNENFTNLNLYIKYNNNNYVYIGKNRENIIAEYNGKNDILWVNSDSLSLLHKYMKYNETQYLLQWWFKDTLDMDIEYISLILIDQPHPSTLSPIDTKTKETDMKHINRFNEFYDTEELKSDMEISNLYGKIDFKSLAKDDNIITIKNPDKYGKTFAELAIDIPFLENMEATKASEGSLALYKTYNKKHIGSNVSTMATLIILIDVNDDSSYGVTYQAKVFENFGEDEKEIFKDLSDYPGIIDDMDGLRKVFRKTLLYKMKKWSDVVKKHIGVDFMKDDVKSTRFNLRHN